MQPNALETPPPVGRRERNKQKVKERLYVAALTLFSEQGYDRTSIDEIAERADVARGTFFNYFQRKEDLIGAWAEERRLRLESSLAEYDAGSGLSCAEQLERAMEVLARINEEGRDLTVAMLTAWVKAGRPLAEQPHLAEVFAGIVKAGCGRGEFDPDLDPGHVGNMLRDLYLGALYRWAGLPQAEEPGALAEDLLRSLKVLGSGLAAAGRG